MGRSSGATRRAGTRDDATPGEGILNDEPPKAGMRNDGICVGICGDGAASVGPGDGWSEDGAAAGEACWVLPAHAISMGTLRFVALIWASETAFCRAYAAANDARAIKSGKRAEPT